MHPKYKPGRSTLHFGLTLLAVATAAGLSASAHADKTSDMAEMQRKLNAETMAKSFEVEDAAKVDAYVADAMKRNLQPRQTAPAGWRRGYTCDSYYRSHRNYMGYRDCVYYHRYYGRYW